MEPIIHGQYAVVGISEFSVISIGVLNVVHEGSGWLGQMKTIPLRLPYYSVLSRISSLDNRHMINKRMQTEANKLKFLLLSLLVLWFPCRAEQPLEPYKSVDASVVCIESHLPVKNETVLGSGFFVAPGIIATTFHQVEFAKTVRVHLADSSYVEGRVLGWDSEKDISLVKVDQNEQAYLPVKPIATALGDEVFTIGCPLGLAHSLTRGVISHPSRLIGGKELLQTDLSVNLGNSGGPLVSVNGEVLGMIYGTSKNAKNGINFAIPIAQVISVMAKNRTEILQTLSEKNHLRSLWNKAYTTGDPSTRLSLYQEIIEEAPWLVEAYFNRGILYHEMHEYSLAIGDYDEAIRKSPQYYRAFTNRGLAYYKAGKHGEARDSLLQAISINSNYAPAFLNLGVVYAQGLSDKRSAEQAYREFLRLSPDSDEAAVVRRWLRDNGSTDEHSARN